MTQCHGRKDNLVLLSFQENYTHAAYWLAPIYCWIRQKQSQTHVSWANSFL